MNIDEVIKLAMEDSTTSDEYKAEIKNEQDPDVRMLAAMIAVDVDKFDAGFNLLTNDEINQLLPFMLTNLDMFTTCGSLVQRIKMSLEGLKDSKKDIVVLMTKIMENSHV